MRDNQKEEMIKITKKKVIGKISKTLKEITLKPNGKSWSGINEKVNPKFI